MLRSDEGPKRPVNLSLNAKVLDRARELGRSIAFDACVVAAGAQTPGLLRPLARCHLPVLAYQLSF